MKLYGIDLHANLIVVASYDVETKSKNLVSLRPGNGSFERFLDQLEEDDEVAIEASTNTFHYYDIIRPRVKKCIILNPHRLADIFKSSVKTDKRDANLILDRLQTAYYSEDYSHLPSIYVPGHGVRELRRLFALHDGQKKHKTAVKNNIHSILKQEGYVIPKKDLNSKSGKMRVFDLPLSETALTMLDILYEQLEAINKTIARIKETVVKTGRCFEKEVRLLTSIKGISPFIALSFMADVEDINRFPNAKKLCNYLHTAPTVDKSNERVIIGSLNKKSRKNTLGLLLQATNHFVASSKKMECFYHRVKDRRKTGISRIGVCRKIITVMYYMLKRQTEYYYKDESNHQMKMKEFEKATA